jgi:hypothetical protein
MTPLLRRLGVRLPWTIQEIEEQWFAGARLNWPAADVERAFDVATQLRGQDWVLGAEVDQPLLQFPGIGRRGGYSEFLRVYWFGIRMASVLGAKGADELIRRVTVNDPDADEEATAIHLLRSWESPTDLEIEPDIKVGERDKKPDFRIRHNPGPWIYVEVTRLHRSGASTRVQELLVRISKRMMEVERSFVLEVILNREPAEEEEEMIVNAAAKACDASPGHELTVTDVASILIKAGDPGVVVPSPTPDDSRPRMAMSSSVVGAGTANRQLIARVPFADERAEEILKREAKQLPKDACGLVMVNVNLQPTAFESWSQRVPERFTPGQHTRVAGVILFMHATSPAEQGLVWLPYLRLIVNPNAKKPLPSWVLEGAARTRSRTKKISVQSD